MMVNIPPTEIAPGARFYSFELWNERLVLVRLKYQGPLSTRNVIKTTGHDGTTEAR